MVVVDANVLFRGLRSRNGASHAILRSLIEGEIHFAMSPAVLLEYEDVLGRPGILGNDPWIGANEIGIVLDALCARCVETLPWFRFRPFLDDPKDDLYIECALAAGARWLVTDDRHFRHPAVKAFGVSVITAGEFERQRRMDRSHP